MDGSQVNGCKQQNIHMEILIVHHLVCCKRHNSMNIDDCSCYCWCFSTAFVSKASLTERLTRQI